jgi:L-amino acid N-acyltransferase YncA
MEARAMVIREAEEADLPSILAIYNEIIASSTAIYMEEPVTLENRHAWWQAHVQQSYPVLVAIDESGVVGFATFGDFRVPPGYRFTVEHSVHVRRDQRGRGVGQALMLPLIERATQLGKHVMIGGVDAQNVASIRFHERLGFEQVAYLREVGHKFGRWLDLVFLQRGLVP